MGLFTEDAAKAQQEQEKFFCEFEAKVHDKPCAMELAECRADAATRTDMGFTGGGTSPQWGLLVFCEGGTYFYAAEQESYMSFFTQGTGRQEEQLVSFTKLQDLQFSRPRPRRPAFLFPEIPRTVEASFCSASGARRQFSLVLNHDATETFGRLAGKN